MRMTQTQPQHPAHMQQAQYTHSQHQFPPLPPPHTRYNTQAQQYAPVRAQQTAPRHNPYVQKQSVQNQQAQRIVYTQPVPTPANTPQQTLTPTQHTPASTTSNEQHATPQTIQATQPTLTPSSNSTPQPKHTVPHTVTVPDKWSPTTEHYDSNTNMGGPVYKQIQATA